MPKVQINRKLLLISLGTLLASGLAIHLLHEFQLSRQSGFYLGQARRFTDADKPQEAIRFYQRAISIEPNQFHCHSELAACYEKIGAIVLAESESQRAEQLNSNDLENLKRLARLTMLMGRFSYAEKRLTQLLAKNPNDVTLEQDLALSLVGQKQFDKSVVHFKKVLAVDAPPDTAYLQLASVLFNELNQPEEAFKILRSWDQKKPMSESALVLRADWLMQAIVAAGTESRSKTNNTHLAKLLEWARADVQSLSERDPAAAKPRELLCKLQLIEGKNSEALATALAAIPLFPNESTFYLVASGAAMVTGKANEVESVLEQALTLFPTNDQILIEAVNLKLILVKPLEARALFERLRSIKHSPLHGQLLEARLLSSEGKPREAAKLLESERDRSQAFPGYEKLRNLQLADCFDKLGQTEKQVDALRRALAQDAADPQTRGNLAQAYLRIGNTGEALVEYRLLFSQQRASVADLVNFTRITISQASGTETGSAAWAEVERILSLAEQNGIPPELLSVLKAEVAIAQNRHQDARESLATAPSHKSIFAARMLLEVDTQNWPVVEQLIREADEQQNDSVEVRLAKAAMLFRETTPSVEAIVALTSNCEGWNRAEQMRLIKPILNSLRQFNNQAASAELADNALKLVPADADLWQSLLDSHFRLGSTEQLERDCQRIEEILGKSAEWQYGKALLTLQNSSGDYRPDQLASSQTFLAQSILLRASWNVPLALSGWLYEIAGQNDTAIKRYSLAIDQGWRQLDTVQSLIRLLAKKGQFREADNVIRKLSTGKQPLAPSVNRAASQINLRLVDMDRAIELAQSALMVSKSADDANWLANLHRMNSDFAKAEVVLSEAVERSPDDIRLLVNWANFLATQDKTEQAQLILKSIEGHAQASEPKFRLAIAECYERLKMPTEASTALKSLDWNQLMTPQELEAYFRLVVQELPSNARVKMLETVLERNDIAENARVWVRLRLCMELASTGQPVAMERAEELVRQNLVTHPKSTQDRHALALVLTHKMGGEKKTEPLKILEQLIAEGWIPSDEDRFIMGQLYVQNGDWQQGNKQLLQVVSGSQSTDAKYVRRYVGLLIANKRATEGEPWIELLQRRGDTNKETARLLAEIRLQSEQFDVLAKDLAFDATGKAEAEWFAKCLVPREKLYLLTNFVGRLKKLNRLRAVEKLDGVAKELMSQLSKSGERAGALYVTQLLSQSRWEEATNELREFSKYWTDDENLAFCDFACRTPIKAEVFEQVLDVFASQAQLPNSTSTQLMVAARLSETAEKNEQATKFYRQILTNYPDDVVALNNLANLLSLSKAQPTESLELIGKAISLKGPVNYLLDTRGVCRATNGDIEGAVSDFTEASRSGRDPLPHFHLAWIAQTRGDATAVEKHKKTALALGLTRDMLVPLERQMWDALKLEVSRVR
jgi:tetratricopeptide (TPR) repeat protein